jgi:uncharacterized protein (TIGR00369 family)
MRHAGRRSLARPARAGRVAPFRMPGPSRITADEYLRLINETIPESAHNDARVEALSEGHAIVRMKCDASHVRAGGTISGPTMMRLVDTALYAAVLSVAGLEAMAVTTDLSFHFLRRPAVRDLIAEARILKSGKKLVVGEVVLTSDGSPDPVAHAVGTYALPEKR